MNNITKEGFEPKKEGIQGLKEPQEDLYDNEKLRDPQGYEGTDRVNHGEPPSSSQDNPAKDNPQK